MFAVLAALLLRSGSAAASLGCASLAERNVTLYADTSFAFAWNFLASRIARSLADDVDTARLYRAFECVLRCRLPIGLEYYRQSAPLSLICSFFVLTFQDKVLDDKTFDMHTGLASLAALHQPRLNRAWYLMTTAIVALLVLLPVAVMSRVQTQFRCAFVRKWLALPAHSRDSMAPYTVCTAVFAALITLFYVFQVCSSVGAENGVDVMQSKAWNIRKDMRAFLNSMNCDIGQVRKKLLGSSDSAAYRHNDTDLKALMQYVLDFKAYLDDEKLRVNIVIAALGHCDELKQAYDSGVSILCNVVLSNTVSRLILHGATSESCDGSRMEQPPLHCLGIALNLLSPCMCSQPFSKTVIVQRRPGRQQPSGNLHEAAPERIVPEVMKAKSEQPPSKCSQRDSSSQNGFWVALVVTALLVACASFTSLRLSRQCLKITRMAEPDALSDKDHRARKVLRKAALPIGAAVLLVLAVVGLFSFFAGRGSTDEYEAADSPTTDTLLAFRKALDGEHVAVKVTPVAGGEATTKKAGKKAMAKKDNRKVARRVSVSAAKAATKSSARGPIKKATRKNGGKHKNRTTTDGRNSTAAAPVTAETVGEKHRSPLQPMKVTEAPKAK
ncbi:hypothetical protein V5799_006754 [Amblyomma americanum]|uniref:Uncharacterized protein n=1 Tax=Amblyomma americanum TaxID=6943 RepID=A0AAQ4DVH5_AMBAM